MSKASREKKKKAVKAASQKNGQNERQNKDGNTQ